MCTHTLLNCVLRGMARDTFLWELMWCAPSTLQLLAWATFLRLKEEGGAHLHWLRGKLDHVLHALAVVVPGLLLVDHIPLMLGKVQEATNGTEVLPESAVFWAGILLPAEQFTKPALERERVI